MHADVIVEQEVIKMYIDRKAGRYKYEGPTGKIIACAFEVQNNLGYGFLEKVYQKALLY